MTEIPITSQMMPDLEFYTSGGLDFEPLPWEADFRLSAGSVVRVDHIDSTTTYIFECTDINPEKRVEGYLTIYEADGPTVVRKKAEINLVHPATALASLNFPFLEFHFDRSEEDTSGPGHTTIHPAYDTVGYVELDELSKVAYLEQHVGEIREALDAPAAKLVVQALIALYRLQADNSESEQKTALFEGMITQLEELV